MKNDKSYSKEEESPSEGARGERLDSIADRLTKIEEMLEELIRDEQRSRKSQRISTLDYTIAGFVVAIGIFVMNVPFAFASLGEVFSREVYSLFLFVISGYLLTVSGILKIIGTYYSSKKGTLIESPGLRKEVSLSYF